MLKAHEEQELHEKIKKYLDHPRVQRMNEFSQHGSITTYAHCYRVTRWCYWVDKRLHLNSREHVLLPGAMLHDMFLYDWHTIGKMNRGHAINHAELACRNATRYCDIDEHTQDVIRTHMWPVNITKLPRTREAVLVNIGDKWCSLVETLAFRRGMKKGKKRGKKH